MAGYTTSKASRSLGEEQFNSSNKLRSIQHKAGGLFISEGGVSLPIEVCLKIVEDVISADPKVGCWALKALSKTFSSLLHSYEASIVKAVSMKEGTLSLYPSILLSSWPHNTRTFASSYRWLCEVRCRTHTIESLINHEVTRMLPSSDGSIGIDLPLPDVEQAPLASRLERFKRDALQFLYGMADSTASCSSFDIHAVRAHQCSFLESLSTTQLAMLGVITRVLGVGYFRMTTSDYPSKTSDSIRDRWIVFEDRVLRWGPFFAWATAVETRGVIHDWTTEVISDALEDMKAFESGRSQGYASLQSVLWKLYCARTEYNIFDSWEVARKTVEIEMLRYEI